jgi:(S)-mandelate dehydrogenase
MKRRLNLGTTASSARNIAELRLMAQQRVPHFAFEYVDGGAEDETTMAGNRRAFDAWQFVPDTLVSCPPARDLSLSLLGQTLAAPLLIAPTGYNGMLYRHADIALARAARQAGIAFIQSTVANDSIEQIASQAGGNHWFQLYMLRDRKIAASLMERAWQAGCQTLVLTSDAVHFGNREWDRRSFRRPMKLTLRNMIDCGLHPRWLASVMLPHGVPLFGNLLPYLPPDIRSALSGATYFARQMDDALDWAALDWLRQQWQGKLVLKGILHPQDALRARAAGMDAIVLSNHGGRQLDSCVSPLSQLPLIRAALGPDYPLLIDSGYRRGTDIAKALCLGASAVLIGRPVLYGVAAGGEPGASHALGLLTSELDRTLAQLGCRSIRELGPRFLARANTPAL